MERKEPKGAYNRAPIFYGENYDYKKEYMSIHNQSVDMDMWMSSLTGGINRKLVLTVLHKINQ